VVGIIGATVMPHALYVHSWLSKNKMAIMAKNDSGAQTQTVSGSIVDSMDGRAGHHPYSVEQKTRVNRLHRTETVVVLAVAGVVNAGILLVAIPLYPNASITINQFVAETGQIFGPMVGIIFVLTLLASGLSASALGTIAGQVIMEGMTGAKVKVWIRRVVTRGINVFPTTLAILLGLPLLNLLVYSQVILSLMIPLPMIPLVYYTSKRKFMGSLVNKPATIGVALVTVCLIVAFNAFLLSSIV
jgi:manganese transport protein